MDRYVEQSNKDFADQVIAALPEDLIYDLVLMKLHAVGLRGAAELMPNSLSGGMARRRTSSSSAMRTGARDAIIPAPS